MKNRRRKIAACIQIRHFCYSHIEVARSSPIMSTLKILICRGYHAKDERTDCFLHELTWHAVNNAFGKFNRSHIRHLTKIYIATRQLGIAVVRRLFKMGPKMVERRLKTVRRLFHPLLCRDVCDA